MAEQLMVPAVVVESFGGEFLVVVKRAGFVPDVVARLRYRVSAESVAAIVRGALADAYLTGRRDGADAAGERASFGGAL